MNPNGIGSNAVQTGLRIWSQNQIQRNTALERLATGLRINRGRDDPAGLISSEAIGAALASLEAQGRALDRSQAVVNSAEAALAEVSSLLTEAQGLSVAAANTAGTSEAERQAMQLEMDSIVQTIDRIASGTSFNGQRLLAEGFSVAVGERDVQTVEPLDAGGLGEVYDIEPTTLGDGQVVVDPAAVKVSLKDTVAGGAAALTSNPALAQRIIGQARRDVTARLGQLGAIGRHAIAPALASVGTQVQSLATVRSLIRDADMAQEASALVRSGVLGQASLSAIGQGLGAQERVLELLG